VNRSRLAPEGKVLTLWESGTPGAKVDLLLIGDGYIESEMAKFQADAGDSSTGCSRSSRTRAGAATSMCARSPWPLGERRPHPRTGEMRRTRVGTEYNVFDSERYALALDNRGWRDIASAAPYDAVEILINNRYYGGGGIFNDHAAVASTAARRLHLRS